MLPLQNDSLSISFPGNNVVLIAERSEFFNAASRSRKAKLPISSAGYWIELSLGLSASQTRTSLSKPIIATSVPGRK